jgi:hypothetical protein
MKNEKCVLILLIILLCPLTGYSKIRFGSRNSSIVLAANTTFDLTQSLTVENGTIRQKVNSKITRPGTQTITFDDSNYEGEHSFAFVDGIYRPDVTGTGTIVLQGSVIDPHIYRADPGMKIDYLEVRGGYNTLEGFPSLSQPIRLFDANTTLTISVKNALTQNILLNGGTIILEDDLRLADGVNFIGTGTINLNGRRCSFGAEDLNMTSSLYWYGAADVFLGGKLDLSASWTFQRNCIFNGDSTTLNLLPGGNLTIRNNSSLSIRQLKIMGLGGAPTNGKIFFEDPTEVSSSELRLIRSALEITTTYTVDRGHVIVEIGSGQFIVADNTFYFKKPARLTVDNVAAYYKTREFADNKNIRNADNDLPDYNQPLSPIQFIGHGNIFHYGSFLSVFTQTSNYNSGLLDKNYYLGAQQFYRIEAGIPDVDGQGWYYHFARTVDNLLRIDAGVNATVTNAVLKDFSPHHLFLTNASSSLIFKDNITIELGNNIPDPNFTSNTLTWTFQGTNKIDGKGKVVSMDMLKFVVQDLGGNPSTLILQDMIIDNFKNNSIVLEGTNSRIIFEDVKIILSEDVSFSKGFFEVNGSVEFYSGVASPEVRFIYDTICTESSVIRNCSKLHFDRNVTFSYAPQSNFSQLIDLESRSSEISIHGATIYNSTVGLKLTKGALVLDHKNFLINNATIPTQGLSFGDGITANNDLTIEFMPGGNYENPIGIININNVNG